MAGFQMNYLALTLLSVLALTGAYLAFCPEAPQPSLQAHKELSFHEHLQKKVEHINSQDLTWKARSHERWEKISKEAFVRSLGVKKPHGRSHSLPKKSDKLPSLPENFDSRVRWPNCRSLKTVRDQSSCGSCWAFGAAEALSDRICIASGQQSQVQISTADLLSCCSECGYGCDGGWPPLAWQYFQTNGVVTGGVYGDLQWCRSYPFPPCNHHANGVYTDCSKLDDFPTPACYASCDSNQGINYLKDKRYVVQSFTLEANPQVIMSELMLNGPLEVDFEVYNDFLTYSSGVYSKTDGAQILGGHAVKLIGWGVENQVPYWLCVNSWNDSWGDSGTFKIKRGTNECEIESDVVGGIPQL